MWTKSQRVLFHAVEKNNVIKSMVLQFLNTPVIRNTNLKITYYNRSEVRFDTVGFFLKIRQEGRRDYGFWRVIPDDLFTGGQASKYYL